MATRSAPRPPTKRQLELLRYIDNFWRTRGRGPLFTEMRDRLKVRSLNAVNDLLLRLVGKELIDKKFRRVRQVWLTPEGMRTARRLKSRV